MNKIEYPKLLTPSFIEVFEIGREEYQISKSNISFEKWEGTPIKNTFGGKTLLNINTKPSFAELVIVELFVKEDWEARWICTYGRGKQNPLFLKVWKDDNLKNQENYPIKECWVMNILNEVASLNGNSFSGCWDVVAWRNDKIIFAESKRLKKDSIRQTQINWFEAGLKNGLNEENFLIVQWDLK